MRDVILTDLVVVEGVVDRDVSLHGDGDGHEDRRGHHHHLAGVEQVGEHERVHVGGQVEALAEALEDGAEEVARVEARQRDQQQVERVPHVPRGQNQAAKGAGSH